MGKLSSLLWGAAIGAGAMYFMDPQNGNRRKAMVRDQVYRLQNQADDAVMMGVNDLRNRARGMVAEGLGLLGGEKASDQVIAERVRARLGFLSRHPGAIDVSVMDRQVTLSGDILAAEMETLASGVAHVRGVAGVQNHLHAHTDAGSIPALQGPGWLPGDQPGQWSPSTRLLASIGAGYLLLYGTFRGGIPGFFARIGGLSLGARAITNKDMRSLLGIQPEGGMQHDTAAGRWAVRKTIQIDAPVDQVYGLWSNFENFPKFMDNVESIHNMGGNKSHWVVKGPAGSKVEFDAVVTENQPDQVIAWETTPDSSVKHHGQVRFKETGQKGTQVSVNMAYTPPAGVAGAAVAALFGKDPKSEMDSDLARMKSLIEEGKTSAGSQKVTREQVMPVTGSGATHSGGATGSGGATRSGGGMPANTGASEGRTMGRDSGDEDTFFPPEDQQQ